jgi:hypothetical protein
MFNAGLEYEVGAQTGSQENRISITLHLMAVFVFFVPTCVANRVPCADKRASYPA